MSQKASFASWRPLLEGDLATQAWDVLEELGHCLEKPPRAYIFDANLSSQEVTYGNSTMWPTLAGGDSGIALFFAYLAKARSSGTHLEIAKRFLDQAGGWLAECGVGEGLHGGFSGVAWTATHLMKMFPEEINFDCEEIDQGLENLLAHSPWIRSYDFIDGLAGLAVYALEQLPHTIGRKCTEQIINQIEKLATKSGDDITWFTPPYMIFNENQLAEFPQGYYNLGLAHGVPGVIGLLSEVYAAGIEQPRLRKILNGAISWLLKQKQFKGENSIFSSYTHPNKLDFVGSRLAWCYGDPGIAITLLLAARHLEESSWENEALEILRHAAKISFQASGVFDAGICHGAAGLAHIFNRAYQATGEDTFKEAAIRWYKTTLIMKQPNQAVAGFPTAFFENNKLEYKPDPGFLTGAAGVGLVLLAAVSPIEPQWDRVLLTSVAPRG